MKTLDNSTQSSLQQMELKLTQSAEDSPVKTLARRDLGRASMASAPGFGESLPVLLASFDHQSCLWRTYQQSFLTEWVEFSETFPRSGMMRNGKLYELPTLAHGTIEPECGWLPTPTVHGNNNRKGLTKKSGDGLATAVKRQMFPTPTANEDAAGTPNGKMQSMLGNDTRIRGETPEEWACGTLSPMWVEWLMGFPIGHTDLKD